VWPDPVKLRALELDRVEAYVLCVTDTHVQVRRVPTDMMGHVGLAVWSHLLTKPADKQAEVTVV